MIKYTGIIVALAVAGIIGACAGAPQSPKAQGWSKPALRENSLLYETCVRDTSSGVGLCLLQGDSLASGPRVEIVHFPVAGDEVVDIRIVQIAEQGDGAFVDVKGIPFTRAVKPLSGYAMFDYITIQPLLAGPRVQVLINDMVVGSFDSAGVDEAMEALREHIHKVRSPSPGARGS